MKYEMFKECLSKYFYVALDENFLYQKRRNIRSRTVRRIIGLLFAAIYAPIVFFRYGIPLLNSIFVKGEDFYPYFEVVVTTKCTLRCKYCANFIQYYKNPYDVSKEDVLLSIDNIMESVGGWYALGFWAGSHCCIRI